MSENELLLDKVLVSHAFGACVSLTPHEAKQRYPGFIGSLTCKEADRIWGKAMISAIAYEKQSVLHHRNNTTQFTRLATMRIELSLRRTSGRILGRIFYTFKKDGREIQHGWRDMGKLIPFNGVNALLLERVWTEQGWMITWHITSAQMRAEMALAMLVSRG